MFEFAIPINEKKSKKVVFRYHNDRKRPQLIIFPGILRQKKIY